MSFRKNLLYKTIDANERVSTLRRRHKFLLKICLPALLIVGSDICGIGSALSSPSTIIVCNSPLESLQALQYPSQKKRNYSQFFCAETQTVMFKNQAIACYRRARSEFSNLAFRGRSASLRVNN